MIGLLQRVKSAAVDVNNATIGEIDQGILALVGIEATDTEEIGQKLLQRIIAYRIFEDQAGKMNRSLQDIQGGLLLVPQFTLVADTGRGLRPSFSKGAPPALGKLLFTALLEQAEKHHPKVASGEFGADMQVHLINDGPVTFWMQV